MAKAIDNLRKQTKTISKQNRTKRRKESMEKYGRTSYSSSDKAYIEGNYKKVASNSAYGYRQGIKNGEIQQGSDNDWLKADSIRKKRTVRANKSWENINPTKTTPKQKYSWFDSARGGSTFKDQMNTGVLDGLQTAKKNQRSGKHISNVLEYIKGGAKDLVVDPLVDTLKNVDRLGSAGMGAILGVAENVENSLKGYDVDKGLAKRNWQSSWETSAKEGWGKGSAEFMNEKDNRMIDKDIAWNKSKGYDNVVKELEELKKNYTKKNAIAGLVNDVIAPIDLGDKAFDLVKGASKGTLKSFKQLKNGTSDLSLAFKKGTSDDVFFSSKPFEDLKLYDDSGANKIHNELDRGYSRNVNSESKNVVKQKVATSSQKPFLASFLDTLDNNKAYSGEQRRIDGRTLNKKYTQTKDGYIPQLARTDVDNIVDNVEKVGNNNQFSIFDKNYNKRLNDAYEDGLETYREFLDDDLISDKEIDDMYDYLQSNHPNYYKELTGESDVIENSIGKNKQVKWLNDNYTKQYENIEKKAKQERKLNVKKEEKLREENAIEKLVNIFEKKNTKSINSITRKYEFSDNIKNLTDKISRSTEGSDEIKAITKKLKGDSISKETKRQQINNLLFGGREIITSRVSSKSMDELLTSIDEIIDVKKAKDWYFETGEITNVKLSSSTRKMLGIPNNKQINIEDVDIDKLTQALNNKSRSYSDSRYPEKLQLLANVYEYKSKSDIEKRIKDIPKELKALDKQPLTQEVLDAKTNLSKEKKLLEQKLKDRQTHWNKIKNLSENDFDKYISENYPQYMKEMSPYKINSKKYKEIKQLDNLDGYKEALEETSKEVANKLYGDKDKLKMYEDRYDKNYISKFRAQMQEKLGLEYVKLDENSIPKNAKKDYKTLTKTKGTKEAISNIKKLLSEELDLRLNGKTKEASILREDIKFYVDKIRKAGIYDFYWFDEMKKFKSNLIKQAQNSATPSNPLEKLGVTINGKTYGTDLNADELQFQFLRSQGAKTLDELFDLDAPDVSRSGDNIGNEIGSMLRTNSTKQNTPIKNVRTPIEKVDDYISDFERFNENENLREIEKLIKENKNKPTKTKVEKPSIEEIDDILSNYEDINVPHTDLKGVELDMSKYPNANADGVIAESLTDKVSNALSKSDDKIKSRNKAKKESIFEKAFKENNGEKFFYEDNELYDMYKSWLNSWKKGLTVYNPGWHVQNYFQNKGQNYLALGMDAFKPQTDARNMLKEIKGKGNKAKGAGKYSKEELMDYVVNNGVIDGLGEDVVNARGIFPRLETKIDNSKFMKKLGENEQTARLHHFLTQINRGMTPDDALKSVNDTLFDYSKKTNVDKVISDFIDPFWTFHKNNAKLIGKTALENPGKLAQIQRGVDGLGERDEYGKQGSGKTFVDDVNGDTYEYRYKQNMLPEFKDVLSFDESDIDSKLNPLIRIAKQLSKGESNFGNEIVDKETADWGEITKEDALKEIALDLNPFGNGLVKTLDKTKERKDKAKDGKQSYDTTDKQVLLDWINYITGNKSNYYRQFKK